MQFILTLLISVRGRKLLKDGSDLSFSGKEAGLTDTPARPGGPGWTGWRSWVWLGVLDEPRKDGEGKERLSSKCFQPGRGLSLSCKYRALAWRVCVWILFLKMHTGTHLCGSSPGHMAINYCMKNLPQWLSRWRTCLQCRRHRRRKFDLRVGKIPRRRVWQPTPGFLPGNPMDTGLSVQCHKGSYVTERLSRLQEAAQACNRVPQAAGLGKQAYCVFFFIVSRLWGLEVWDPGVSSVGVSEGLSPWLADSYRLPVCSHCFFHVCAHLCLFPF